MRLIQVPPSYHKTMSNAIKVFMDMQGIDMIEGDVWGHRKDLDEYFAVEDSTMKEIVALAEGGASLEDVASLVQKKVRLCPDLIKYIAKNKITV
jgi:hypothetical protein